jgi:hypothetical protein
VISGALICLLAVHEQRYDSILLVARPTGRPCPTPHRATANKVPPVCPPSSPPSSAPCGAMAKGRYEALPSFLPYDLPIPERPEVGEKEKTL